MQRSNPTSRSGRKCVAWLVYSSNVKTALRSGGLVDGDEHCEHGDDEDNLSAGLSPAPALRIHPPQRSPSSRTGQLLGDHEVNECLVPLTQLLDHSAILVVIGADVVPVEDDHAVREAASDQSLDLPLARALPGRRVDATAGTRAGEARRGHGNGYVVKPRSHCVATLLSLGLEGVPVLIRPGTPAKHQAVRQHPETAITGAAVAPFGRLATELLTEPDELAAARRTLQRGGFAVPLLGSSSVGVRSVPGSHQADPWTGDGDHVAQASTCLHGRLPLDRAQPAQGSSDGCAMRSVRPTTTFATDVNQVRARRRSDTV